MFPPSASLHFSYWCRTRLILSELYYMNHSKPLLAEMIIFLIFYHYLQSIRNVLDKYLQKKKKRDTSTPCDWAGFKPDFLLWAHLQFKTWVCYRYRLFALSRVEMRVKRGWRHPKPETVLMYAWVRSHAGVNRAESTELWWYTLSWVSCLSG